MCRILWFDTTVTFASKRYYKDFKYEKLKSVDLPFYAIIGDQDQGLKESANLCMQRVKN